jgi:hypothetical protein
MVRAPVQAAAPAPERPSGHRQLSARGGCHGGRQGGAVAKTVQTTLRPPFVPKLGFGYFQRKLNKAKSLTVS